MNGHLSDATYLEAPAIALATAGQRVTATSDLVLHLPGFTDAPSITLRAVGSYPTFSPLP